MNFIEILEDFSEKTKGKNINVTLISERGNIINPESYIEFFRLTK